MFVYRQVVLNNGLSLKSLAADLLSVSLDKSLELRCSDWEADRLTLEQVAIPTTLEKVAIATTLQHPHPGAGSNSNNPGAGGCSYGT